MGTGAGGPGVAEAELSIRHWGLFNNMDDDDKSNDADNKIVDYVTALAKGTAGIIPFGGSFISEILGVIIPNQRIDRIAKFSIKLEGKLSQLEERFVRSQLTNENFTDLAEEGFRQAARSLSDERREYIAKLVVSGLTDESIEINESKHLLRILGELNDIEIIWLQSYSAPTSVEYQNLHQLHPNVLDRVLATSGSPRSVFDKETLQESYTLHLAQIGLLKPEYRTGKSPLDPNTETLTIDVFTRDIVSRYSISRLGMLLLKHIGLVESKPKKSRK